MATADQIAALNAHIGGNLTPGTEAILSAKIDEAEALVTAYLTGYTTVPEVIRAGAVTEVAGKLWARRNAPMGQVQLDTLDGGGIPAPRDPMVTAYPMLDPFLDGGFA